MNTPKRWGGLGVLMWFVLVGFAPLWVSTVLVYLGSLKASASSEYWAAAPWLMVLGFFYCGLSLAVATVTYLVYRRTAGSLSRRLGRASGCFIVLAALSVAWAWWPRHQQAMLRSRLDAEAKLGIAFVQGHAMVQAVWGGPIAVMVHMSTQPSDPKTAREITYFAYPIGNMADGRMVIVKATHPTDAVRFTLRCIVTQFSFQNHEAQGDPCHPRYSESHRPPSDHEVVLAEETARD